MGRPGTDWEELYLSTKKMAATIITVYCLDVAQHSNHVCVDPPEEEDSSVVLGTERLDVAGAPLEPSPSAELPGPAEE